MKQKKNFRNTIVYISFLTVTLMSFGQFLGEPVNLIPDGGNHALEMGLYYFRFIGIWVIFLLAIVANKANHPFLKQLTPATEGNNWKMILVGIAHGFFTNAICILVAWLNKDIHISFACLEPLQLIGIYLCILVQSSAEELVCRVYMYQKIKQTYPETIAIIANSLLFAILHLFNDGVTALSILNIVLVGIAYSLLVYCFKSPWCAFFAHATWNFTQNIIFGLPNSGIVSSYSVFTLDAANARDSFAYSTSFGIEGTFTACLVLLLCIIVTWYIHKRTTLPQSNGCMQQLP